MNYGFKNEYTYMRNNRIKNEEVHMMIDLYMINYRFINEQMKMMNCRLTNELGNVMNYKFKDEEMNR